MQGTTVFKEIIWNYLLERAENDEQIALNLDKGNKSLEGCINYILSEVKKSGCNGFSDDEIYSMAVHYYDEDSIEEVKPIQGARVVVNQPLKAQACNHFKRRDKANEENVEPLLLSEYESEN